MNRLTPERRAAVIRCLVEGNSIRATVRITGAAKNTVAKLALELGYACAEYQDRVLRDLSCQRVQCDEIWSFVGCKEKNVPAEEKGNGERGDVWTWTAIDADSRLAISWRVGDRSTDTACDFMEDVAGRLKHRVQLTTDGHGSYLTAVEDAFGGAVDYAQLVKIYGNEGLGNEKRYSPDQCIAAEKRPVVGDPDPDYISTSFVERQNLTMRMSMRRFTRLTNGFSKKLENHACAVALHFMYYNFVRPHQTLSEPYPTTPAMAAGVNDHVWSFREIVELIAN